MLGSRPDLSYSITYFSQFQNNFTYEHWNHLKGVLRYLKNTKNVGLKYIKSSNPDISVTSFVDSDFANSTIDRKSITGFVTKINANVICWKTRKQNTVSLSSAEAEYVALSTCITENIFICQLLSEIINKSVFPIDIFEDNMSCIKMASTLETKRTKHIDIKHHFVRDCILENKINLLYIPTDKQEADMFTKALSSNKFKYFKDLLNIVCLKYFCLFEM